MKKITKKIEQSMVVIALSLTQITTPILVIAETSEADQPAETISKIDKEKDPILASSEKEASSFTSSASSQEEVDTSSSEENEVDQSEETSGIKDSSVAETETNKSSTDPKIVKKEENASRSRKEHCLRWLMKSTAKHRKQEC